MPAVSKTVFSTRCFARAAADALVPLARRLRAWGASVSAVLLVALHVQVAGAAELSSLRTERGDDGIYLSAQVEFEIPAVVEDALLKGIALIFVAEAEILRERWYWTNKRVAASSRSLRLAFQPLTRRWRVSLGLDNGGGRVALVQNFESLAEAKAAIQRISRWKIAEPGDVDGSAHLLSFRFRLDLGQLPRPFQIGVAGQREWQIQLERTQPLRLEKRTAELALADER